MTERKVIWEAQILEDPSDHSAKKAELDNIKKMKLDSHRYDDDEDDDLIEEEIQNAAVLMESPFGLVEVRNKFNPYLQYSFWMLHTNFDISSIEFILTNYHEGVEVVQIQSRYRMLVAFGKLFDEAETRKALADRLINIEEYDLDEYRLHRSMLTSMQS